jgi:hypothetical protein
MKDHALRVGEELVIPGRIRLTILAVEEGKVVLGITAEANHVRVAADPPAATPPDGCAAATAERQLMPG